MITFNKPEEFSTYLCCFLKEHKSYKRFLEYHSLNNDKEFEERCLIFFERYFPQKTLYVLLDIFYILSTRYSKNFKFFCELRLVFIRNIEDSYFPKNYLINEQCWDD